ncbi:MAG: ferredoxin-type protein NapF [Gammaproteobacteria bacterium]|nr:ferredoxin-type protein NapF [Gammaproteobacteria bacterium]MCW8923882.1 ferredoxin-type protein NapF [Gammaproteobacteria bacterium]
MSTAINRMQFLRGDYSGKNSPIRPPWSVSEKKFLEICNGCGECIEQCPTNIIKKGRGNYPVISFSAGECLFCGDCVETCEPGALTAVNDQLPWSVIASINNDNCIAFKGIECRSCYDPCNARAINMPPRLGGVSIPVINTNNCSGCGACFSICPVSAITMNTSQHTQQ